MSSKSVSKREASTAPLVPSSTTSPNELPLTPADCSVEALRASGRAIRPLTSPNDDREHLIFVLPNGLRVCVVSDPAAAQAACAVGVHVGHQSDGHIPGAAHFAEHLCFMGSDKFPGENDFSSFLSQNGGGSNASTGGQTTTYHCRITPSQLRPAMARLSRFFIAPLFLESTIAREAHAVHNEWSKNLPTDSRRAYHLDKATSNPLHPYSQFGSGNAHTLHDLSAARAAVVGLWNRFYVAENMTVAVVGTESVEVLRQWVEAEFADVRPCAPTSAPAVGTSTDITTDPSSEASDVLSSDRGGQSQGKGSVSPQGLPARYGPHPLLSNPLRRASLPQQRALAALAGAVPTMNVAALYPQRELDGDETAAAAAADAAAVAGAAATTAAAAEAGASAPEGLEGVAKWGDDPEVDALLLSSRAPAAAPVPTVASCNTTDLASVWRPSVATDDPVLAEKVLKGAPKEGTAAATAAAAAAADAAVAADATPAEVASPASVPLSGGVPESSIRAYPGSEGAIITWVPNRDRRVVELTWSVPPEGIWPGARSGATPLLGHILGDEGPGSLLAVLKSKGLATSVSAGGGSTLNSDYAFFSVEITLTEAGLRNMWAVIAHVYWSIGLVVAASDAEILKQHTTFARLREIAFRFQSRPSPEPSATALAGLLRVFPASSPARSSDSADPAAAAEAAAARTDLRYATCMGYILDSFAPAHLRRIVRCLTPARARVNVSAKHFAPPEGAGKAMELREVHYGTEYRRDLVPEWALELCQRARDAAAATRDATRVADAGAGASAGGAGDEVGCAAADSEQCSLDESAFKELALPAENVFAPTDFTIVEPEPEPLFVLPSEPSITAAAATAAAAAAGDGGASPEQRPSLASSLSAAARTGPQWARSGRGSARALAGVGVPPLRRVEEVLGWRAPVVAEGGELGPAPEAAALTAAPGAGEGEEGSGVGKSKGESKGEGKGDGPEEIPRALCSDPVPPRLLLRPGGALRLWHRTDRIHRVPRTYINVVALSADLPANTVDDRTRLDFFAKLVSDALDTPTYAARCAGLSWGVDAYTSGGGVGGIEVTVSGYSQTVGKLLALVLEELTTHQVSPARFAILKERVLRTYRNSTVSLAPLNQAAVAADTLLSSGTASDPRCARYRAAEAVTEADVRAVAAAFAAHSTEAGGSPRGPAVGGFVEMGVFGNATRADALALARTVARAMPCCAEEDAEPAEWVKALLPAGAGAGEGSSDRGSVTATAPQCREYQDAIAGDAAAAAAASDAAAAAGITDGAASAFTASSLLLVPALSAAGHRAVAAAAAAAATATTADPTAPLLLPHLHTPLDAAFAPAASLAPAPAAPLRPRALHASERVPWSFAKRSVLLDGGEAAMLRLQSTNAADDNSAIRVFFQTVAPAPHALLTNMPAAPAAPDAPAAPAARASIEEQWLRVSAAAALLGKMIREPCFTSLRAKQALAYIVHAGLARADTHMSSTAVLGSGLPGLVFIVQSSTHSAAQLQRRLHGFLREFRATHLEEMSEEVFVKYVNAIIEGVLTQGTGSGAVAAAPTPHGAAGGLWSEVRNGRGDFDFAPERLLPHVRALTREHLKVFFDEYVLPPVGQEPGPHRRVLSLQVEHQRHVPAYPCPSPGGGAEGSDCEQQQQQDASPALSTPSPTGLELRGSDESPVPEDGDWDASLWATTIIPPDVEGVAWWKATHATVPRPAALFSKVREHERWVREADAAAAAGEVARLARGEQVE